jgi:hypothetical protein
MTYITSLVGEWFTESTYIWRRLWKQYSFYISYYSYQLVKILNITPTPILAQRDVAMHNDSHCLLLNYCRQQIQVQGCHRLLISRPNRQDPSTWVRSDDPWWFGLNEDCWTGSVLISTTAMDDKMSLIFSASYKQPSLLVANECTVSDNQRVWLLWVRNAGSCPVRVRIGSNYLETWWKL